MGERLSELWFVVPCMSRLAFVRQTAPSILANGAVHYCLVDYSCPDRCGDWLATAYPDEVAEGRAVSARAPGHSLFNKSRAHNLGARCAIDSGAEYLCLLDADTVITPAFVPWVLDQVAPDRFLIAARRADGTDPPSLTGLVVLHARAFLESGGLDESFSGWGGEDIEFRVRLRLLHGLEHADVPLEIVSAIPHGDDLRTQHYRQKSCGASNRCNLQRLNYRVWNAWRERWKVDPRSLERLWYRGHPQP